jgi:hypothetical protein
MTAQSFTSAGTCLRQVPALFKWWQARRGFEGVNLDIGGGRYEEVQQWMNDDGIPCVNLVLDPYNRIACHNMATLARVAALGGADSVTVANVLNVIDSEEARSDVLVAAKGYSKPGAPILFSIHEGDKSGVGRETRRGCWQNNRRAKDYAGEISLVLRGPIMASGNVLVYQNPKVLFPRIP